MDTEPIQLLPDPPPAEVSDELPMLERVTQPPPALPEAPLVQPPRPLVPGAFLRQEFEVKEIIARGLTNLYLVQGGDYGDETLHLIAERAVPQETQDAEVSLESPLFPPCEKFTQDEREYLIFDFSPTTALQDHRQPTNDVKYLRMLDSLARGLLELQVKGLGAHWTLDVLRCDGTGAVHYYGFVDPVPAHDEGEIHAATPDPLAPLRQVNDFLLKRVFAESATMRLDDEFGSLALSEEVKELARRLSAGEFATPFEVVDAIALLYRPDTVLRAEAALLSDVGQEREVNEDAGLILRVQRAADLGSYAFDLYAVADGMGGHEGGEVASDLTLTALERAITQRAHINWNDNVAVRAILLEVIEAVNAEVVALTQTPKYRVMRAKPGSTLVFALRLDSRVFIGNVGDSRAYKYNEARGLQRITKDHSYVQSLIDQGLLTEEDAWDHPDGSIITAHIGEAKLKKGDVFLRLFAPGDKLLLVSDGVVDMLRDGEIAPFLKDDDPVEVCRDLVGASNVAGGADNITVVCVSFR
ncbi:MAG: protein phosphatase 2C domain-containing protein [Armatimonadota bacterium]|nr:protein phosphatase 2C domain-containing protein [Armatimonadota bacterium]